MCGISDQTPHYHIPRDGNRMGISHEVTFNALCTHFISVTRRFLSTFAKLRTETINFVMSVRPSVSMEQPSSRRTDFHEILYLDFFRKSLHKNSRLIKT